MNTLLEPHASRETYIFQTPRAGKMGRKGHNSRFSQGRLDVMPGKKSATVALYMHISSQQAGLHPSQILLKESKAMTSRTSQTPPKPQKIEVTK
eukprot:6124377-Amphidinium_carterae.1